MDRVKERISGFSLVELLIVLAITTMLVALLLPALQRARRASFAAQCMSNQRQIAQMHLAYSGDFKGYMAPQKYELRNTDIQTTPNWWVNTTSTISPELEIFRDYFENTAPSFPWIPDYFAVLGYGPDTEFNPLANSISATNKWMYRSDTPSVWRCPLAQQFARFTNIGPMNRVLNNQYGYISTTYTTNHLLIQPTGTAPYRGSQVSAPTKFGFWERSNSAGPYRAEELESRTMIAADGCWSALYNNIEVLDWFPTQSASGAWAPSRRFWIGLVMDRGPQNYVSTTSGDGNRLGTYYHDGRAPVSVHADGHAQTQINPLPVNNAVGSQPALSTLSAYARFMTFDGKPVPVY